MPAAPSEIERRISEIYTPFDRQREFHACPAKYRLFGGAAGGGKTKALLFEAIRHAVYFEGVDTLLLRRTFPELEATLLHQFRRDVPHDLYRSFNDTKHIVTWHNGSTTRFGYSASETDIYQYQGAEYLFIGVDELTLFTLRQWQYLTSRNRCSVSGTFPNMAGATNPGHVGHAWVKALWVDRRPASEMETAAEYDASDYAFIPARVWDNPIYCHDANYLKSLRALPRAMRQAYLEGDWNVLAGQYFDIFDPARHVVRVSLSSGPHPDGVIQLEPWWPRWISIDWGFQHPSAVYWHAAAPDGRTITYREFVQAQLSPRMLGQAIVERSVGEHISEIFLSPDAFAERTSESTIADQLATILERENLPAPAPADNDRVGGWMLLYQLLESGHWLIGERCVKLRECLPSLVRDDANLEDVLKTDGDDPADSARYGLKSRLRAACPPLAVRLAERVTATDPTSRAIQTRKALLDEQHRLRPVRLVGRF